MDDLPEALRDRVSLTPKRAAKRVEPSFPWSIAIALRALPTAIALGMGIAVLLAIAFWLRPGSQSPRTDSRIERNGGSPQAAANNPTPTSPEIENILGHLPYAEAPAAQLQAISPDGRIRLKKAAAVKFLQMQAAARAEGISLQLISGFRSVSEQQYLFFKVKEQRNQATTKRAEVSAPPGYSEHHTGYAIDLGDGKTPATNLSPTFEKTAAFRWLQNNANKYSFEISFPRNNVQGVSYEPWHWRYVGDGDSLETFYKARTLKSSTAN
jgi:D-alanyl-D-alanine carboxypeptidase